jgi:hypothetical protein
MGNTGGDERFALARGVRRPAGSIRLAPSVAMSFRPRQDQSNVPSEIEIVQALFRKTAFGVRGQELVITSGGRPRDARDAV